MVVFMKVYYFNDEQKTITVKVHKPNSSYVLPDWEYIAMPPYQGRVFEFDTPENSIPYIKRWADLVMISYISSPREGSSA